MSRHPRVVAPVVRHFRRFPSNSWWRSITSNATNYANHVQAANYWTHRFGTNGGNVLLAHCDRAEELLAAENRSYMTVKTLSSSRPDEYYDRTRGFYLSIGFQPLEEFPTLWNEANPCLLMIKTVELATS